MGKGRILIVDDDSGMRSLLRSFLEMEDFEAVEAEGAEKAMELLAEQDIHLILSDMKMPGFSGLDLLKAVRDEYPNRPVIIITGKPNMQAAIECMRIGALDYITKPCDFERLRESIDLAMESSTSGKNTSILLRSIDEYEVLKQLGDGAMGMVFLAEKDGKKFAVKVMKSLIMNPELMEEMTTRFTREIEIATSVQHPNVIKIVDHGASRDENLPYFVMEYVDGPSLKQLISDPPTMGERIRILAETASALAALHEVNIVHRDLKPANVLLTEDHHVRLTDFGISQIPESNLTISSKLFGTPAYMAPEAFQSSKLNIKADLFSFGVIAYQLLTGRLPFNAPTIPRLAVAIANLPPVQPNTLNPEIPELVERTLAVLLRKEPQKRILSARDVETILQGFIDEVQTQVTPPNTNQGDWQFTPTRITRVLDDGLRS